MFRTELDPSRLVMVPGWRPSHAGRWARFHYSQSFASRVRRPQIVFFGHNNIKLAAGEAAAFGRGSWFGRVPENTKRIGFHLPADCPREAFRLDDFETIPFVSTLPRAFLRQTRTALKSMGAYYIGALAEHAQALKFARGGVSFARYLPWMKARTRPIELDGLDAAPSDVRPAAIVIVIDEAMLDAVRQSPIWQSTGHKAWAKIEIVCLAEGSRDSGTLGELPLRYVDPASPLAALGDGDEANTVIFRGRAGDQLPEWLPLALGAEMGDRPPAMIYADEDFAGARGQRRNPQFKPDWSPLFEAEASYIGRAVFWNTRLLRQESAFEARDLDSASFRQHHLTSIPSGEVRHMRRVALTSVDAPAAIRPVVAVGRTVNQESKVHSTIIIPNKNALVLLRRCVSSLLELTHGPLPEIVVVDNGSTDPAVLAYYEDLKRGPTPVRVRHYPHPFNFSAMCNLGAEGIERGVLVFLNNDTEVIEGDWLTKLAARAMTPDIGAVGAKLLFDDMTIQHCGISIGLGGYGDHTHHGKPQNYPGYLGRLRVAHEVSAVTGACLAVEARKFHAVGGFDAEHLPVELNDVDLCLRLGERGFRCLQEPGAVLKHHESKSRGRAIRPFSRYARERAYFARRWADSIADDPYFNPSLSLFSTSVSLDG